NTLRTARAPIAVGRQPAAPPADLAAHALATGFSRGFLVAAGIGLLALLIGLATIRVSREELTGTAPAPQPDTAPQPAAVRQQEDQAALAAAGPPCPPRWTPATANGAAPPLGGART